MANRRLPDWDRSVYIVHAIRDLVLNRMVNINRLATLNRSANRMASLKLTKLVNQLLGTGTGCSFQYGDPR
jgi:hypothetical protein